MLQGGRDAGKAGVPESDYSVFPKPVPSQCSWLPSNPVLLLHHPQLQSGIGRLILKEEMKARSSSYADPWTPPRSSTSSREALHTAGYEMSLNGCKHCSGGLPGWGLFPPPCISESKLLWPQQGLECRLGEGLRGALSKTMLSVSSHFCCFGASEAVTSVRFNANKNVF